VFGYRRPEEFIVGGHGAPAPAEFFGLGLGSPFLVRTLTPWRIALLLFFGSGRRLTDEATSRFSASGDQSDAHHGSQQKEGLAERVEASRAVPLR
jgi:hypothetical protein